MKTIIQIVQHLKPGGIETMALDLHSAYAKKGYRSYILSLEGDAKNAISNWPRLTELESNLIFIDKPNGFSFLTLVKVAKKLFELKADAIHSHHIGPLLYGGLSGFLSPSLTHVHTEHDAWHLQESDKHLRMESRLLKFVKPILVADANIVAEDVGDILQIETPLVVKNGIDIEKFIPGDSKTARQKLKLPTDKTIVGCSGRLEEIKGHRYLIDALSGLHSDVHLALAGAGSQESTLRAMVENSGLSDRVHFVGRIDEMATFYQALDCFCLPSLREGMPLSPLEAQSCGITAVVTDVGGSVESLCPLSGILVPAANSAVLVDAIKMQLSKSEFISPRTFVKEKASVDVMAASYSKLFCFK